MHKWIRISEIVIIFMLIIVSAVVFNSISNVRGNQLLKNEIAAYHVAVITDEGSSYALDTFIDGIDEASAAFDIVYEIYNTDLETLSTSFDAVGHTGVDGIVVKLSNNSLAREWILSLKEHGKHVVLVGNDDPESKRDVYIGTNKYQLGKEVASLAGEATGYSGDIALIFGSEYNENAVAYNHFISGVNDVVKSSWDLSLQNVHFSENKRAEVITDELLGETNTRVIVCTDPTDVIRTMRVLVDRNEVGAVQVIGNGRTSDMESYIDQKLVYASIVEDYRQLGHLSMTYLSDIFEGKIVSGYVNVPFEVIKRVEPPKN